jgi:hypothetical protein
MAQLTTAGRLLEQLHETSPAIREAVVYAAGLSTDRADAAMRGALRLSLSEQLRLSEATLVVAPKFSRDAMRLRTQVLAARSYEAGELIDAHREVPVDRWEHNETLSP